MKTTISLSMIGVGIGLLAVPCRAASPVDDVKNAAAKLAEQSSYSWTTKVEQVQTNRFRGGGAVDGQTEKSGLTVLTFKGGNNNTVAVRKGEKVAIKQDDEWKTAEELAEGDGGGGGGGGGRFGRNGFLLGRVQRSKLPAQDVQELLGNVKELKK